MKTTKYAFLVFLFSFSTSIYLNAQDPVKIDSLLSRLDETLHDTIKVKLYIALHEEHISDSTKAIYYVNKAIGLSEKIEDWRWYCLSNLTLSKYYSDKGQLINARKTLDNVKGHLLDLKDKSITAQYQMGTGLVYLLNGTYDQATDYYLKALRQFELEGDTASISICHLNLGSTYWHIGDLDKAMVHYQKSLTLRESSDRQGISKVLGNLGLVARAKNDYEAALDYYNQSLKICLENNFRLEAAINLQNIGVIHEKQQDYTTALDYFIKSNELSKSIDDKIGILYTDVGIATLFSNLDQDRKATTKLKAALPMAHELNVKTMVREIHINLSETYEKVKDYESALVHRKEYERWNDSIIGENHLKEIGELEIKYESEKKDQRITRLDQEKQLQEKETQRQATLKKVFIGGATLITLFAALLFHTFRQRLKNQKVIAAKNEEIKEIDFKRQLTELEMKALQAQINPHFIFNCINSINQMILDDDNKNASKYLTKFSKLIRMILENVEETEVTLSNELNLLETYIQLESIRFEGNIKYEIGVSDNLDIENTYLPSMVLQPFVENAIWHGLRHRKNKQDGKVLIAIEQQERELLCRIEDNGVGRQKAIELQQKTVYKSKSMGLKITEDRLKLLSNEMQKQLVKITDLLDKKGKPKGTLVEVSIPIA